MRYAHSDSKREREREIWPAQSSQSVMFIRTRTSHGRAMRKTEAEASASEHRAPALRQFVKMGIELSQLP